MTGRQSPVLPPGIPYYFLPLRGTPSPNTTSIYRPMLLGVAQVGFVDKNTRIDSTQPCAWLIPMIDSPVTLDWDHAEATDVPVSDLESTPEPSVSFAPLPAVASQAKSYETWQKDFLNWLYRTQKLDVFRSPSSKVLSNPGETEREFRVRLQQLGREQRDQGMDRLRKTYTPKITALEDGFAGRNRRKRAKRNKPKPPMSKRPSPSAPRCSTP